ncbi:ABC transporter ATP-binding protein [Paenibacillus sp. P25]|nr:ABC transporter ATP-binding protein [Paenibacillus sp. P25]
MIPAIKIENVWKKYKIYQDKPITLKEKFLYRSKGVFQEKWVLQDVSITIPKGKMVGLIGRNGSGKSTLLKILTKILMPDKGYVEINGRVSSLLELGAGFHMDFTGRENIYMNASIFGLSRKEIDKKLEEIIEFSELSNYIDNPVRTYSSGMYMRLAFSIAIHVDPDVLLIDEILAVGDSAFQKKCISKIEEFKRLGKTIVFVSHDNGTMERLCDEVYWIHESKVKQSGDPREVIRDYMDFLTLTEEERMNREIQNQEIESKQEQIQEGQSEKTADQSEKRWGNKKIEIKNILLKDANGDMKNIFGKGTPMTVEIKYDVNNQEDIDQTAFGFGIFKNDGTHCYGTNTFIDKQNLHLTDSGILNVEISSLNLTEGKYFLDIACHHIDGTPYDYIKQVCSIPY